MSFELVTRRPTPLGSGTRPADTVLAVVSLPVDELSTLIDQAYQGQLPAAVEVSEGIEKTEVITALRSLGGGAVILRDPSQAEVVPSEPPAVPPTPSQTTSETPNQYVPIDDLKLPSTTKRALKKAGLETVGDVAAYGNEHNGLTDLPGIGEPTEKAIIHSIKTYINEE